MDPNQPDPNNTDEANDQPTDGAVVEPDQQPAGETAQTVKSEQDFPATPPNSSSDGPGEDTPVPEKPPTQGNNQPYTPSPGVNNFASDDSQLQAADEQASVTPAEPQPAENAEVQPALRPEEDVPIAVTSEVAEQPTESAVQTESETQSKEQLSPVQIDGPVDSADAGSETSVEADEPDVIAEPRVTNKRSPITVIKEMEKAVLISVAVVSVLVMLAVLYFIFFSKSDAYAGYKTFKTYNGSLSSLNLSNETAYTIDYPLAMTEDTGAASKISNWFLAADYRPDESGEQAVNSILDLRLDSQSLLGTTKDQELELLGSEDFISLLEADLAKDLKDRFAVTGSTFDYGGTIKIGVDQLDGYLFDFTGLSGNPDAEGESFSIIGRYYIGFSDEVRFSIAELGQAEYWQAGLEAGTWQSIVDSVDIN